jgi:hypothetical protein
MVLILVLSLLPAALIETSHGQSIQVTVGTVSVTLNMNLVLRENLTALPAFNLIVTQSNASSVFAEAAGPINDAFRSLVPTSSVSNLMLQARTTNSTGTFLLEENYTIIVTGANQESGSVVNSNLSFVQMNLSQPFPVANQELNAVGKAYLLQPINNLSTFYSKLIWFIDGSQALSAVIPGATTTQLSLLDFSWVPPISTWNTQSNILEQSTTWTYNPAQPEYNLTVGVPSPEGPVLKAFTAIYNPTLSVTVPSTARITGNTISFDTPTSSENIMPVVAGASLAILIGATLLDRRVTGPLRIRKKKR